MEKINIVFRKSALGSFLVFSIVLLQLNQRPAMLQAAGEVLGLTILALLGIYGLLGYRGSLTAQKRAFLLTAWTFGVYLWAQVLVLGEGISRAALINVVFIMVSSATVILITRETWQAALKAVVYPAMALGLSYACTVALVIVGGLKLPDLTLFSFNLAQAGVADRYLIRVYFPVSPAMHLGSISIFGIEWARAVGYMREPGIYQTVACVAYFGIDYVRGLRGRVFWKGILLLSVFLTFSTAGIGAFLAAAFYYYVIAGKDTSVVIRSEDIHRRASRVGWGPALLATGAIFVAGYWFIFTEQVKFGLMRKLAQGSGSARVSDLAAATEALFAHPFLGVGYTNKVGKGFSFLGVTGEIGIIGVVLFLAVLIIPLLPKIRRRDRILALLVSPFLTAMLSQPLFDKPLFYLLVALVVAYPHDVGDTTGSIPKETPVTSRSR